MRRGLMDGRKEKADRRTGKERMSRVKHKIAVISGKGGGFGRDS